MNDFTTFSFSILSKSCKSLISGKDLAKTFLAFRRAPSDHYRLCFFQRGIARQRERRASSNFAKFKLLLKRKTCLVFLQCLGKHFFFSTKSFFLTGPIEASICLTPFYLKIDLTTWFLFLFWWVLCRVIVSLCRLRIAFIIVWNGVVWLLIVIV